MNLEFNSHDKKDTLSRIHKRGFRPKQTFKADYHELTKELVMIQDQDISILKFSLKNLSKEESLKKIYLRGC